MLFGKSVQARLVVQLASTNEVTASNDALCEIVRVSTLTRRSSRWTRSPAVWLDEPQVGVRLLLAPAVVLAVVTLTTGIRASLSSGQSASDVPDAEKQLVSAG